MTVPALFGIDLVLLVLLVPLAVVALLADLITGFGRRRYLRLLELTITYLAYETTGVIAAFGLWVATGFGLLNRTRWSQHAHARLQVWWATSIGAAITRILRTEFQIEGVNEGGPGPVIMFARHTSFGDALLPSLVLGHHNKLDLRHVLMKELSYAPAIDIVGHRMPNHFVDRTPANPQKEADAIEAVATGLSGSDAAIIFPEGRFFTPKRKASDIARLRKHDPKRADQAEGFDHLLPPRPTGALALLRGAPNADIVFMAHVGFEPFTSFKEIWRNVPFRGPIHVKLWRVRRADVPSDPNQQVAFLFDWWQQMDEWITKQQDLR